MNLLLLSGHVPQLHLPGSQTLLAMATVLTVGFFVLWLPCVQVSLWRARRPENLAGTDEISDALPSPAPPHQTSWVQDHGHHNQSPA
jgi:hypothetical protein